MYRSNHCSLGDNREFRNLDVIYKCFRFYACKHIDHYFHYKHESLGSNFQSLMWFQLISVIVRILIFLSLFSKPSFCTWFLCSWSAYLFFIYTTNKNQNLITTSQNGGYWNLSIWQWNFASLIPWGSHHYWILL